MEHGPYGEPRIVSLADFRANTTEIIREMNEKNHQVLVTRHGRFLAIMQPLANIENLEGKILSEAIEKGHLVISDDITNARTADELLAEFASGPPRNREAAD